VYAYQVLPAEKSKGADLKARALALQSYKPISPAAAARCGYTAAAL